MKKENLEQTEYQGIGISIENPEGSIRQGISPDGKRWATVFFYPYGFINGTRGMDEEEIDCFVGPNPFSQMVYVVHQKQMGRYDEDKVIFGFDSLEAARDAYLAHFDTQMKLGPITEMSMPEFKEWIGNCSKTIDGTERITLNDLQRIAKELNSPKTEVYIDESVISSRGNPQRVRIRENRSTKYFHTNKEAYDYLFDRLNKEG